jgi:hypothetical protein
VALWTFVLRLTHIHSRISNARSLNSVGREEGSWAVKKAVFRRAGPWVVRSLYSNMPH